MGARANGPECVRQLCVVTPSQRLYNAQVDKVIWPSGRFAVEPVRVKVYGLFSLTKRRYVTQAVTGVVFVGLLFAGWCFGWPPLRDRLTQAAAPESAFRDFLVAVLDNVPWILFAVFVYKAIEVFFVLRAFARHTNPKRERGI
jgi:hypothetical protein